MERITKTDLEKIATLQEEALRFIENENYGGAFQLANAIDEIFYRKNIDLVEAMDWCDNDLLELRGRHNGPRTTSWGARRHYAWEMDYK